MCLAIPAIIKEKHNETGWVKVGDAKVHVNLLMTPEAEVGDWVLIHAGFAIQQVDEAYAKETLQIIDDNTNFCDIQDTTI